MSYYPYVNRMLFSQRYKPTGPLFANMEITDNGNVKLNLYLKYRDYAYRHNCFINLSDGCVDEQVACLDKYTCPHCKDNTLCFAEDDKFNVLYCDRCNYQAWSDRVYYVDDFY